MLRQIERLIRQQSLLEKVDGIVIGVSGGADSICLLYILIELKKVYSFQLKVVHVHHGIRGDSADKDAKFVKGICEQLDLDFVQYNFEIKKDAKKHGLTEEEMGRRRRYEVFEKERSKFLNGRIAVAHHMNDHVETVLHNFMRGTGLKGLGGIRIQREAIIRPLLNVTRGEIEQYLNKRHIDYCTDETNLINDYTRNKIRNELIPYIIKEFNPNFVENRGYNSFLLQQEEDFIEISSKVLYNNCVQKKGREFVIDLKRFREGHKALQNRMLRMVIFELNQSLRDFEYKHIRSIQLLIKGETGKKINLPNGIIIEKTYNSLRCYCEMEPCEIGQKFIPKPLENDFPHRINLPNGVELKLELNSSANLFCQRKNLYTKWFDYDKIENTLIFRTRLPGDYIYLKGVKGKKKLKDFFIDMKVPRNERDQIILLADGQNILWILGYRDSEFYKIDSGTKKVLNIVGNEG